MRRTLAVLALAGCFWATPATAQTNLEVNGGFYRFGIDAVDSEVTARPADFGLLASNGGLFFFELFLPGRLWVWDFQQNSEQFRVTINGFAYYTSETDCNESGAPGCVTENDPFAAVLNPFFSRGFFDLGPGNYEVSVVAIKGAKLPASGAIGLTTVPEPLTLLLLAPGLLGVGVAVRRRRGGDLDLVA